jgi:hypothetical protein
VALGIIVEAEVTSVSDAGTALLAPDPLDPDAATTTGTVAIKVPTFAVTVIVRGVPSPAVTRVTLAIPSAPVLTFAGVKPPEVAEKLTATPESRPEFASLAYAVIVAPVLPSVGMVETSLDTVMRATLTGVLLPLVTVPAPPAKELVPLLPPPQAVRARAASAVIQRNVRIVFTWAIDP